MTKTKEQLLEEYAAGLPTHCPQCKKPKLTTVEVGWRKHRVIGESPRGYQFSVLSVKVPTMVIECSNCDYERHGYVYDSVVHLDEEID